jgi:hypothetical protein
MKKTPTLTEIKMSAPHKLNSSKHQSQRKLNFESLTRFKEVNGGDHV